ncbi:hypothetical protein EVAR_50506_1 [Eumeta japonica]|uniref:Uncharacterized protein n=1 Tax=Eumeta variegata TaxID=151549 RepID=A0A4C1X912_EUMVA|nr:hypothetical protein EVAR_50506_1 [Eumeta japonica]
MTSREAEKDRRNTSRGGEQGKLQEERETKVRDLEPETGPRSRLVIESYNGIVVLMKIKVFIKDCLSTHWVEVATKRRVIGPMFVLQVNHSVDEPRNYIVAIFTHFHA